MKSLLQSRTFWLAVFQAIGAVAIVAFTEMDMMAYALWVKSILDIILRMDTREEIML